MQALKFNFIACHIDQYAAYDVVSFRFSRFACPAGSHPPSTVEWIAPQAEGGALARELGWTGEISITLVERGMTIHVSPVDEPL